MPENPEDEEKKEQGMMSEGHLPPLPIAPRETPIGVVPHIDVNRIIKKPPEKQSSRMRRILPYALTFVAGAGGAAVLMRGCESPPRVAQDPLAELNAAKDALREARNVQENLKKEQKDLRNQVNGGAAVIGRQNDQIDEQRKIIMEQRRELASLRTEALSNSTRKLLEMKELPKDKRPPNTPMAKVIEEIANFIIGRPDRIEEIRAQLQALRPAIQDMDNALKLKMPMDQAVVALDASLAKAKERKGKGKPIFDKSAKEAVEQLARTLLEINNPPDVILGIPKDRWEEMNDVDRFNAHETYNYILRYTHEALSMERAERQKMPAQKMQKE